MTAWIRRSRLGYACPGWDAIRDPAGFVPQPYEQLAATYQSKGQDADARAVLVAKHRSMRRTLLPPARLWSLLQDVTVGYGHRPLRAVRLLLCLF